MVALGYNIYTCKVTHNSEFSVAELVLDMKDGCGTSSLFVGNTEMFFLGWNFP